MRARQRKEADRVSESQHVVENLQLTAFSKPAMKSKSTRPKTNTTTSSWSMVGEGFAFIWFQYDTALTLLSLSYRQMCMMHACGVEVVFLEHGALRICKSSVCTQVGTSVRFIYLSLFCRSLVSEPSGRKSTAERSALQYKNPSNQETDVVVGVSCAQR